MSLNNQDDWERSNDKTVTDKIPKTQPGPSDEPGKNADRKNRRQFTRLDNNRFFD
ncbi:MAG: hypothetical protein BWY11_02444 [Firmicutes bacterium ADurb.Bin182]|nr:MAG: hypothetical protein BWY11_02444 [Firmicutes bacterium ADurb.Bin182]